MGKGVDAVHVGAAEGLICYALTATPGGVDDLAV
jgi:hypothetical protein